MRKFKLVLILFLIVPIIANADDMQTIKNIDAFQIALKHTSEHSNMTEAELCVMNIDLFLNKEEMYWKIEFRYSPVSECPIVIYLNALQGNVVRCNCEDYSRETLERHWHYCDEVFESFSEARLWESALGPYQLWNVEENALFYKKYNHIPFEDEGWFYDMIHYDMPPQNAIQPNEAIKIAQEVLTTHLDIPENIIETLVSGSYYYQSSSENESYYHISYYKWSENHLLDPYFTVSIRAVDGLCIWAERINQYDDQLQDTPRFWTDIYEFEESDGILIRKQ